MQLKKIETVRTGGIKQRVSNKPDKPYVNIATSMGIPNITVEHLKVVDGMGIAVAQTDSGRWGFILSNPPKETHFAMMRNTTPSATYQSFCVKEALLNGLEKGIYYVGEPEEHDGQTVYLLTKIEAHGK
jgi:hypothetical protein